MKGVTESGGRRKKEEGRICRGFKNELSIIKSCK